MATSNQDSSGRKKLALIIGNGNYKQARNKLSHPINNARDLSDALKTINFYVTTVCDTDRKDMSKAVIEFAKTIDDGDLVLFYYCGHASQCDDENYLIPIDDDKIRNESDFEGFAIGFNEILLKLSKKNPSYATIFVLDCSHPYLITDSKRSESVVESSGLRKMSPKSGVFIQFASCAPDQATSQRIQTGRNSLFTKHLLKHVTEKNVDALEIFRRIENGVRQESNQKQNPLSMNGLSQSEQLYLNQVIKGTNDYLSDEPIPKEEAEYYEQCKDYYQCTGKPLVSIANEVFDTNTQLKTPILKFGIDEDCNRFDINDYVHQFAQNSNIDSEILKVRRIQRGSVIVTIEMSDKIESKDKRKCLQLIYKSLSDHLQDDLGKMRTFFMFLGSEESLIKMQDHHAKIQLNPQFNRKYGPGQNFWQGPLKDGRDRGGKPYYCPVGWRRWSFYVTENFEAKFNGWCIGYHGTKFAYGLSILLNGLKPADVAVYGKGVYFTPSINYAAHPRYAEVKRIPSSVRRMFKSGQYIQYVLETRVHPNSIKRIGNETLRVRTIIDPNIDNQYIEWLIDNRNKSILNFNDPESPIVCTGLMIRITDNHPGLLPESQWWYESHLCENEKCCRIGVPLLELHKRLNEGQQCNIIFD